MIFNFFAIDEGTLARIGGFVGASADRVDIEFALDPARVGIDATPAESGMLALVPTNIFASLASNDSTRVLVFAAIFGVAMVMTERQSGGSIFGALQYIQAVCILIFDWFGLLVPIGIVALIAPQVALIGSEVFAILAMFSYAFFVASALVLIGTLSLCRCRCGFAARRCEHAETDNVGRRNSQHAGLHPNRSGAP